MGHHVDDLHIAVGGRVSHHRVGEEGRLARRVGHDDTIARFDPLHRLVRRGELLPVKFLPIHGVCHSLSLCAASSGRRSLS